MTECIVDTFGIVQDFADLHGDMNTPLYQAIMDVMVSRQREEIVRCCDCKEYRHEDMTCHSWQWHNWDAPIEVDPDGFCAWGERRSDGA